MLIKGEDADNIILGDTFTRDGFDRDADGKKWTFDYMLANPPFGVEWKQQQKYIEQEADTLGYARPLRRGHAAHQRRLAALSAAHDLQDAARRQDGGSRIGIVFNGSPLFTGDAGSGESEIRRWIIENDWLEAIVALPDQLFYNTGISTYIWVLTNRKEPSERKGKVQLIDARHFWVQMERAWATSATASATRRTRPKTRTRSPRSPASIGNFQDGETRSFTRGDGTGEGTAWSARSSTTTTSASTRSPSSAPCVSTSRPRAERIARLEERDRLQEPRNQQQEERNRPPAGDRGRQGTTARRSATCSPPLPSQHGGTLFKDRKAFLLDLREVDRASRRQPLRPRAQGRARRPRRTGRNRRDLPRQEGQAGAGHRPARHRDRAAEGEHRGVLPSARCCPTCPTPGSTTARPRSATKSRSNRHFYRYEPPRELTEIEAEIKGLEGEILDLLREVTA